MLSSFSEISITIPPDFLWGILAVFLVAFIVISLVLNYHWQYYGIKDNPKIFTKTIHWLVSIILILIMVAAIFAYESNL